MDDGIKEVMQIKIKVTKELYHAWDPYNRRQVWIGKQVLKNIKDSYSIG